VQLRARATAPALPESLWHCIAAFLAPASRRHLLLLSAVCRATRQAVNDDHSLWVRLLRDSEDALWKAAAVSGFYRVPTAAPLHFVHLSPCPDFLSNHCKHRTAELRQYRKRALPALDLAALAPADLLDLARHSRKRVCLQEAPCCGLCGARRHHHPFWALGMRVCTVCLKLNLVSGSALYIDYGLDFTHGGFMRAVAERVFFFGVERRVCHVRDCLSHNPADFMCPNLAGEHTFFWKPHLAAVVDLPAAAARLRSARALAPRLSAAVRALYVRLVVANNGRPFTLVSSHAFAFKTASDAECGLVAKYLPGHLSPVSCTLSCDARAALQRLFLAAPRLVAPLAPSPVRVWSALMTLEGLRAGRPPLPPYLPRVGHMSLPDVALYRACKERGVPPY